MLAWDRPVAPDRYLVWGAEMEDHEGMPTVGLTEIEKEDITGRACFTYSPYLRRRLF